MTAPSPVFDDSQIALRIAVRAAIYTAVMFIIIISIANTAFGTQRYEMWLDMFLKCMAVLVALMLTTNRINEGRQVANPNSIPFLSTFFFYGATLLLVYIGQMGYIAFQIFFGQSGSFTQTIQFLLGIHSFSVKAFIGAFLAGHLPYLVYYLNLRARVARFK